MKTEIYEAKARLHEQEVHDAARHHAQNHSEAREHSTAANIRIPPLPVAPANIRSAIQNTLPRAAVLQAESVILPLARAGQPIPSEASAALVDSARRAQQARLTPHSGQNESQQGQAMVGLSDVATQKMESSMAEQEAEQQAEEVPLEEAEAQTKKWFEVLRATKQKNHEREARAAAARALEEAESQAEQTYKRRS